MSNVLIFQHRGFATALPAGQVVAVASVQEAGLEQVQLWSGVADDDQHALFVRSPLGEVAVSCRHAHLEKISYSSMLTLTPLLRASFQDMPYVVGATWFKHTQLWLVDMSRYQRIDMTRIVGRSARPDDE